MKEKIILTDHIVMTDEGISVLKSLGEVLWADQHELIQKVNGAKVIVVEYTKITGKVMDASPILKGVIAYGIGYDHIDVKEASERGIYVVNLAGLSTETVAEFTISSMVNLMRKTTMADTFIRRGKWKSGESAELLKHFMGKEVNGRTLGIIGLGKIGGRVAEIAEVFNMQVLAYDPYVNDEVARRLGVKLVDLDTLLKKSDAITLHMPLTSETREMIGKKEISLMKPESYLINTARGGVVDQEALVKALKERKIAGAALDVFIEEPIPPESPLLKLDNVLLSPHMAGVTKEWLNRASILISEEAARIFRGEVPKNLVNKSLLIEKGYLQKK